MINFNPFLLQKWTQGCWSQVPKLPLKTFCFDTREMEKCACFLAIKNEHKDGHLYVRTAQKAGASAAIVEDFISDCSLPQLKVKNTLKAFQSIAQHYRDTLTSTKIFAITGSCGKTSTKEFLATLLGPETFKTPLNFNNHLGVPFSLTKIDPERHENAVIEVGINQKNEMDILGEIIHPDIAILLNICPVHLEYFKDFETIAKEKIKLLNCAKTSIYYPKKWGYLLKKNKTTRRFEFLETSTSENFYKIDPSKTGWEITLSQQHFHLPFLLGNAAVQSFALAIKIALDEGIAPELIQTRLFQWTPLQNRGAWQCIKGKHIFLDCYNANPWAFRDSLQHFYREKQNNRPVCYCLGSMAELGEQSSLFHQQIASYITTRPQDMFVCIGDFAADIEKGLVASGVKTNCIATYLSLNESIPFFKKLEYNYFYVKGSHSYHLENLLAAF